MRAWGRAGLLAGLSSGVRSDSVWTTRPISVTQAVGGTRTHENASLRKKCCSHWATTAFTSYYSGDCGGMILCSMNTWIYASHICLHFSTSYGIFFCLHPSAVERSNRLNADSNFRIVTLSYPLVFICFCWDSNPESFSATVLNGVRMPIPPQKRFLLHSWNLCNHNGNRTNPYHRYH